MKIKSLLLLLLFPLFAFSQSFWKNADESKIFLKSSQERQIIPNVYATFSLDMDKMKAFLNNVPKEFSQNRRSTMPVMEIPFPDGSTEQFYVYESSVMMSGLAAKYPQIKSYKGYSTTHRSTNIRFDIGTLGFRGSIRTLEGNIYIDSYASGDPLNYIVYYTRDYSSKLTFEKGVCGMSDIMPEPHGHDDVVENTHTDTRNSTEEVPLRTLRTAIACTGEWGQIRGNVPDALSDMVTGVNRLNLIFENEMGIRILLINENDQLIHLDPATDPYTSSNSGATLLGQNTNAISNIIGFNSYDLGHIFALCTDVGGIANLGSVCTGVKGAGVTCQFGAITPDVVSITSHEMGHQFSANHTFNNCGGNESGGNAFEPGSGTTIMSYSGLCGPINNIMNSINDDYYHQASLAEIYNFTKDGGTVDLCASKIPTLNHAPEITKIIEKEYVIPISTPFELTGAAIDEDGDILTYSWEEKDLGPQVPLGEPTGNAPAFRSRIPSTNPTRTFPSIQNIVNGTSNKSEVLPTYSRSFNFAFTVRDNNPEAGMAVWDYVRFLSTDQAGPFVVEYPSEFATFLIGDQIEVLWDVANTNVAPVNCQKVNIYLSDNTGTSFDYLLAENVPNTGSASVIIPNTTTLFGRIKVKAADNIFLDISNKNFRIDEPTDPAFYMETDISIQDICNPELAFFNISTIGFGGISENIRFETIGLPMGAMANFSAQEITAGDGVLMDVDFSDVSGTNSYSFILRAIAEGIDTLDRTLQVRLTGTDFSDLQLVSPMANFENNPPAPVFQWLPSANADSYNLELANSPSFENNIITVEDITSTNYKLNFILDPNKVYFWRVNAVNKCQENKTGEIRAFNTAAFECKRYESSNLPINITGSGTATVVANINVLVPGKAGDVNVKLVQGDHERVGDLEAILVSPSGKEVRLWKNKCSTQSNFSCAFDDEAPVLVNCPLSSGETFIPEQLLEEMKDEDVTGVWKLRLVDSKPGSGGKLKAVTLELCSSLERSNPIIVHNEILPVIPGLSKRLKDTFLLTEDPVHDKYVLLYTLVKNPAHGTILLNGIPIDVGDSFRQIDINDLKVRYVHNGDEATEDNFHFSVTNPDGGWTGIENFIINISPDFVSSNEEIDWANNVLLYPNPASESFFIKLEGVAQGLKYLQIMDITGRIVLKTTLLSQNLTKIATSNLKNGIYVVQLSDGTRVITKKLVVH